MDNARTKSKSGWPRTDRYLIALLLLFSFVFTGPLLLEPWVQNVGVFSNVPEFVVVVPFLVGLFAMAAIAGTLKWASFKKTVPFLFMALVIAIFFGCYLVQKDYWSQIIQGYSYVRFSQPMVEWELSSLHGLFLIVAFLLTTALSCLANSILSYGIKRAKASGLRLKTFLAVGTVVLGIAGVIIVNQVDVYGVMIFSGDVFGPLGSTLRWVAAGTLLTIGVIVSALIFQGVRNRLAALVLVLLVFGLSFGPVGLQWQSVASTNSPGIFTLDDAVIVVLASFAFYSSIAMLVREIEPVRIENQVEQAEQDFPVPPQKNWLFGLPRPSAFRMALAIGLFAMYGLWWMTTFGFLGQDQTAANLQKNKTPNRIAVPAAQTVATARNAAFIRSMTARRMMKAKLQSPPKRILEFLEAVGHIDGVSTNLTSASASMNPLWLEARFKPGSGEKYFSKLRELSELDWEFHFQIHSVDSKVDMTPLQGRILQSAVHNSELKQEQFEAMAEGATWLQFNNCRFVPGRAEVETASGLVLQGLVEGQTANLLGYLSPDFKSFGSVCMINECQLGEADWDKVISVCHGRSVNVSVNGAFTGGDELMKKLAASPDVTKNLSLRFSAAFGLSGFPTPATRKLERDFWRFVINYPSVQVNAMWFQQERGQEFWDAVFAGCKLNVNSPITLRSLNDGTPLSELFRKFHFCLDELRTEEIRNLYIPFVEPAVFDAVSKMPELRTLSFDRDWIGLRPWKFAPGTNEDAFDSSALAGLTKLEKFYLPSGVTLNDWTILKDMASLQKIQFDAFGNEEFYIELPVFDPSVHTKLQEVVMFNLPPPWLLNNLNALPSINRVTIVDEQSEVTPRRLLMIKKMFGPDVKIEILTAGDPIPPPREFSEHIERVRVLLRKKYLAPSDEDAKKSDAAKSSTSD